MSVNDPISDMLTRIRNAGMARKPEVLMPSTKVLVAIAKVLKDEGYIGDYEVIEKSPQNQLKIALRYGADLKAREIAVVLGQRTNAVEVALHRALERLRAVLDSDTAQPAASTRAADRPTADRRR